MGAEIGYLWQNRLVPERDPQFGTIPAACLHPLNASNNLSAEDLGLETRRIQS